MSDLRTARVMQRLEQLAEREIAAGTPAILYVFAWLACGGTWTALARHLTRTLHEPISANRLREIARVAVPTADRDAEAAQSFARLLPTWVLAVERLDEPALGERGDLSWYQRRTVDRIRRRGMTAEQYLATIRASIAALPAERVVQR